MVLTVPEMWWCPGVPHRQSEEQYKWAKADDEAVAASRTKHMDPLVPVALKGTMPQQEVHTPMCRAGVMALDCKSTPVKRPSPALRTTRKRRVGPGRPVMSE